MSKHQTAARLPTPIIIWKEMCHNVQPGSSEASPLLLHAVNVVADGAPWLVHIWFLSQRKLSYPSCPLLRSTCKNEAPAKTVAEQTAALASQHGKAFAENAMGSVGVSSSNVTCFGLAGTKCQVNIFLVVHKWGKHFNLPKFTQTLLPL